MSNHLRTVSLVFLLTFAKLSNAADLDQSWITASGTIVQGHLSEVYGSLALVVGKNFRVLVPLEKMTDTQLERVADHLADAKDRERTWEKSNSALTKAVRNKLEQLNGGTLKAFPGKGTEPKIYLIYFSAGWCGPCHRFTPLLVDAYEEWKHTAPGKVEVIFVSWDTSDFEQFKYARDMKMPWKVLSFREVHRTPVIGKWAGNGIPCLVAMAPGGDVLFHSYRGEEYLGADFVLEQTRQLLKQDSESPPPSIQRHRLAVIQHIRAKQNASPEIYLAAIDPKSYQTLEADKVNVTLEIDATGHVSDSNVETPVSLVAREQFRRDLAHWLFLPSTANGVPCVSKITIPIQMTAQKTALNVSTSPNTN